VRLEVSNLDVSTAFGATARIISAMDLVCERTIRCRDTGQADSSYSGRIDST